MSQAPEDFIPSFRRKKLNEAGFLRKLARFAEQIGEQMVFRLYTLYYTWKSPDTPARTKWVILGALVYFFSPIDSIPDLLGPLGFSDDIAVITLVYSQVAGHITESVKERAREAAGRLFGKASS